MGVAPIGGSSLSATTGAVFGPPRCNEIDICTARADVVVAVLISRLAIVLGHEPIASRAARLGNVICARKSKLIDWIEQQEAAR